MNWNNCSYGYTNKISNVCLNEVPRLIKIRGFILMTRTITQKCALNPTLAHSILYTWHELIYFCDTGVTLFCPVFYSLHVMKDYNLARSIYQQSPPLPLHGLFLHAFNVIVCRLLLYRVCLVISFYDKQSQ